jgi:hypothetical protein
VAGIGAARRLAWTLWLVTVVLLVLGAWLEVLNAPARGSLWQQSLGLVPLSLPFATVGALIAARQSHNLPTRRGLGGLAGGLAGRPHRPAPAPGAVAVP